MKKLIMILALLPVLFFACSKSSPDNPEPEEKKYAVQFKANLIDVEVTPIGKKISSNKSTASNEKDLLYEGVSIIDFFILNSSNDLIGSQSLELFDYDGNLQHNALEFKSELPKGDYTIGVLARPTGVPFLISQVKDWHFFEFRTSKYIDYQILPYQPIYIHKYSTFTVNENGVNKQVVLSRLNAQLELDIQDEIPANVKYLLFGGKSSGFVYPFRDIISSNGGGYIKFDLDLISNQTNKTLKTAFYPIKFSVFENQYIDSYNILLFDSNDKYLGSKTIDNIYFKENHITRLKGNFFDMLSPKTPTSSIKIDFVKEYSSNVIEKIF